MILAVYVLCAVTSLACAVMLLSAWRRSGSRLLFWCGVGFIGLATNNVLLVVDIAVLPDLSLRTPRGLSALAGAAVILYGLIRETASARRIA